MRHEFFGVVDELHARHARLVPLARFEGERLDQRDSEFDPSRVVGPTGRVLFLGDLEQELPGVREGSPIWFEAEENPEPNPRVQEPDRYWVPRRGGRPQLARGDCYFVLSEAGVDHALDPPQLVHALPPGTRLYQSLRDSVEGPWEVGDDGRSLAPLREKPYQRKRILHFPEAALEASLFVSAYGATSREGAVRGLHLSGLSPTQGKPIDLANGKQVATWLLKLVSEAPELASILKHIDREHPGWRRRLETHFDALSDNLDRQIYLDRLRRLDEILSSIELGEEELSKFASSPAFSVLWQQAVAIRRAELEGQAQAELAPLREERDRLDGQVARLRAEEERLHQARQREVGELGALRSHLVSERSRLVRDAAALLPLGLSTEGDASRPAESSRDAPVPAYAGAEPGPAPGSVDLGEKLEAWGVDSSDTLVFDSLMTCCRLVLVPDPAWVRAYVEARGGVLRFLQVGPHWLTFGDAWGAGMAKVFREDPRDDGARMILHLLDLDRSPAELWLRPVLDLASGLRDSLAGGEEWPSRLVVTASLCPGPPRMSASGWVLQHFAAPVEHPDGSSEGPTTPESQFAPALERLAQREERAIAEWLRDAGARDDEAPPDRWDLCLERARELRRRSPSTYRVDGDDGA